MQRPKEWWLVLAGISLTLAVIYITQIIPTATVAGNIILTGVFSVLGAYSILAFLKAKEGEKLGKSV